MASGTQLEKSAPVRVGQPQLTDRLAGLWGRIRVRWAGMQPAQRGWAMVAAVLLAALLGGLLWYCLRTDWRTLYVDMDPDDVRQASQALVQAQIPFEPTTNGTGLMVPAAQLDKARLLTAAKGLKSGRMGFELFDKPNWVGSEFDEKVNYQRAMEGELEHTIGTIAAVRSARVHLVLPKDSLFGDEAKSAKASVVLQLKRSTMPPEQVEAIRGLVAGAVENLSPEDVTLVDADGRLNLNARGPGAVADDAERGLEDKLVAMLEPTAGSGNVRATVNVSYDESSEEKTDDVYDPAQVATLTMHKSEQTVGQKTRVSGVPGTASNTPAAAAVGSVAAGRATVGSAAAAVVPPLMQTANSATAGTAGATQKEAGLAVYPQSGLQGGEETATDESGSYAVSRHQSHMEQGPGRIRRVTAAVVVNDRMSSEGTGKQEHAVWKPRSAEEMQQLEQLARAAVGFDATRGDQVVIENVGFSSNMPEIKGPPMQRLMDETSSLLNAQPGLLKTMSVLVLGLLLVMLVLKPMTSQMMTALSQTPPLALSAGHGGAEAGGIAGRASGGLASGRAIDAQGLYEHVSVQIRREPAQSTRLLESWISETTEEGD